MSNMLENQAAIAENLSEVAMSPEAITREMSAIVREAAEPGYAGESVKAAIRRAAFRLALSYRRAKSYWYGDVKLVPAHEADRLRKAKRQILRDRASRLNSELEILQLRLQHLDND